MAPPPKARQDTTPPLAEVVPLRPASGQTPTKPKRQRRNFGAIRKLRSGRHQAFYKIGEQVFNAPVTFETRADADAWLAMRHAELLEHRWKPVAPP